MSPEILSQWLRVCQQGERDALQLLAACEVQMMPSRIALAEAEVGCWRFARAFGPRPDAHLAFAEGVAKACIDDGRPPFTTARRRCEKCTRVRDTMTEIARQARELLEPWLFDEAAPREGKVGR